MNLQELIDQGENKRVEFKEQLLKNKSVGKVSDNLTPFSFQEEQIIIYLQEHKRMFQKR